MTPHLVGLAKELENEPFHWLALYCQREPRETVVAYARSQGIRGDTANVTVTGSGQHHGVKGNGYVPYSMVFDQHGELVYHHMSGDYHGGDGLELLAVVRRLVEETPVIYLGRAPFEHVPDLAADVSQGKGVAKLEAAIAKAATGADDATKAELGRLSQALRRFSNEQIARLTRLLVSDPSAYAKGEKELRKRFAKTSFESGIAVELDELAPLVKPSIAVHKELAGVTKKLAKLDPCEACKRRRLEGHQLGCPHCALSNAKHLKKLTAELEDLWIRAEELPIASRVTALRESL